MSTTVSPLAPKEFIDPPAIEGVRLATGSAGIKYKGRTDVLLAAFDKGTALAFLRGELHEDPDAPALFIGDDRTDEDAFRELGPEGWGIIVAEPVPAATLARAWLRSPDEVAALLARLAADDVP